MHCSIPGLPVHHQLLEITQTHVHWVGDAIQPPHPLSSPSPIFPSMRVFSNESVPCIRWLKYWSLSFSISPSNEYLMLQFQLQHQSFQDWFPLGWTGLIFSQSKGLSRVFSKTIVQKHQFFSSQLSLWSNSHIHIWLLEKPYLWPSSSLLSNFENYRSKKWKIRLSSKWTEVWRSLSSERFPWQRERTISKIIKRKI